jgi:pimeloyl-ACP methyl ester carboxylesterase
VLVHGLFADGSSWSEVIPRLQAAGLNVTSVQNPLTTLPEAVASAERVLARQDGPTVLVGHSFSGMIVTEAGVHPNVSALVYVAARAPDAGEDYTALAKTYPTPPASAGIVLDGDEGRLSEEAFLRDFAGDLPEAKAKVLYAVQEPFHKALLTGKTTHAAWRSKPSYYAVSTEDRTINPDLERFMAKRMGAQTIEVKASHLSLISHPLFTRNQLATVCAPFAVSFLSVSPPSMYGSPPAGFARVLEKLLPWATMACPAVDGYGPVIR